MPTSPTHLHRDHRDHLRAVLDTVDDGVVAFTGDGRIETVNRAVARVFGYGADDLVGWPIEALIPPPPGHPASGRPWFVAPEGRRVDRSREVVGRRKDGSPVRLELGVSETFTGGDRGFVAVLRDVAERERSGSALEEGLRRFRLIAERIEDVCYTADYATGRVSYASPAFEAVFARRTTDLLAAPDGWTAWIHPDDRARVAADRARLVELRALEDEYRILRPDGSEHIVQDRAFLTEAPGVCAGVVHDVTLTRSLEQQVLQSHKLEAMGALASGIAHDFNNLVSAAGGQLELALDALPADHPARDYVERARAALGRGRQVTRRLLAFARKEPIRRRPIEVDDVIVSTADLLRPLLGSAIELDVRLGAPGAQASLDPLELEHVLLNLATNARDAMAGAGRLTISTRLGAAAADRPPGAPDRCVEIAVRDTGRGMTEQTRARLFEPFFSTKPAGQGTGLGLATSQATIASCGGAIAVDSAPGRGTTFTIRLPHLAAAAPAPPAPEAPAPAEPARRPGARGTLLVVEDDETTRLTITEHFEQLGFRVLATERPSEAFALAEAHDIDLLVTDHGLPQMTGDVLADRLRAVRAGLRVLVLSGRDGLTFGDRVLVKPFTLGELTGAVESTLAEPAPR
jgi:PAS domain S-box-containing protein